MMSLHDPRRGARGCISADGGARRRQTMVGLDAESTAASVCRLRTPDPRPPTLPTSGASDWRPYEVTASRDGQDDVQNRGRIRTRLCLLPSLPTSLVRPESRARAARWPAGVLRLICSRHCRVSFTCAILSSALSGATTSMNTGVPPADSSRPHPANGHSHSQA